MKSTHPTRRRFLQGTALGTTAALLHPLRAADHAERRRASSQTGTAFLCVTCGVQYPPSEHPPAQCPICLDERQYVGPEGQKWTTLAEMQRGEWRNAIRQQEPDLIGIGTEPKFAIGQRALIVRTPAGNFLWDCVSLLDELTLRAVRELGGLAGIAISHPHYYSAMVEWSHAFGGIPIYLHAADRPWVQRTDPAMVFWEGETRALAEGLTLIHTGGHFDGFQVLHWRGGADGRGVILAGDQPQVCASPDWVSFMYSYPNFIPLGPAAILRLLSALDPWPFDRLYGAFWPSVVKKDAKGAVRRSAERYLRHIA